MAVTTSVAVPHVPLFLFLPHFDVICDLLLTDSQQHGMYLLIRNTKITEIICHKSSELPLHLCLCLGQNLLHYHQSVEFFSWTVAMKVKELMIIIEVREKREVEHIPKNFQNFPTMIESTPSYTCTCTF